jgi:tetratricopeptide (TPR) repeat protein
VGKDQLLGVRLSSAQLDIDKAKAYLDDHPEVETGSPDLSRALSGALRFVSGQVARAAEILDVDWSSSDAEACGIAGAFLLGLGRFEKSLIPLLRAVNEGGFDKPAHLTNLGRAYFFLGRYQEALQHLNIARPYLGGSQHESLTLQALAEVHIALGESEKALELFPENDEDATITAIRVHILCGSARFKEALRLLRNAIEKQPDLQDLLLLSVQVMMVLGLKYEAHNLIKKAIDKDSENVYLWARLTQILVQCRMSKAAKDAASTALNLSEGQALPLNALALTARAEVLALEGNLTDAEVDYRKALDLVPNNTSGLSGLGRLLLQNGRVTEAIDCFERVRVSDPLQGWMQLINARELPDDPEVLESMERMARRPGIEGPVISNTLFTLATAWDKKKNYDKAFKLAQDANDATKNLINYKPDSHRQMVDKLLSVFSKDLASAREGWGLPSRLPVFVLGMPRSGTTLTEQILASHSKVFGAGELGLLSEAVWQLDAWERRHGTSIFYPECIFGLGKNRAHTLASGWLKKLSGFDPNAIHVVDKLPHNFQHIGFIKLLFPNAIIFHCRREARDIAISNYITDYAAKFGGMGFAYDLGWIGEQLVDHDRLMRHWHELFPGQIFEVVYEDLVEDTESWARQMIDFMGLEWEPGVLEFQDLERPVKTASVWQVRQPVYTTSKERWKRYEAHLKPLEEALSRIPEAPAALPLPAVEPELFSIAMSHMKAGRYTQAIEDFGRLLEGNPRHAAAHHFLGGVYFEIHDLPRALACMRQSVKLHPLHATWWENLAKAEASLGEEVLAQQARQRAQQLRKVHLPTK